MDQTATRELDTQALEQILIGHIMAIAGEVISTVALASGEYDNIDPMFCGRRIAVRTDTNSLEP